MFDNIETTDIKESPIFCQGDDEETVVRKSVLILTLDSLKWKYINGKVLDEPDRKRKLNMVIENYIFSCNRITNEMD